MLFALLIVGVVVGVVAVAFFLVQLRQVLFTVLYHFVSLPKVRAAGIPHIHDSGWKYNVMQHCFILDAFDATQPSLLRAMDECVRVSADSGSPVVCVGRAISSPAPVLVVCSPEGAKEVGERDDKDFVKGGLVDVLARNALHDSILTNVGEEWRVSRRALTPLFHFSTLKSYVPNLDQLTETIIEEFEASNGEPMHPGTAFSTFTLRAVIEMAFDNGVDVAEAESRFDKFEGAFGRFLRKYAMVGALAEMFPYKETREMHQLRDSLFALAKEAIANLRKDNAFLTAEPDTGREGLIRVLLRAQQHNPEMITDDLIAGEMVTFLAAGRGTTAAGLVNTIGYLAQDPDAQDRMAAEVEAAVGNNPFTLDAIENLRLTRHALEETLRFIGIGASHRVAVKDTTICGVPIPKGSDVVTRHGVVGRHPNGGWPHPNRWDLDNWEDGVERHSHSFVSFWSGPRNCIGRRFALQEAVMALAKIVRNFKIEPASKFFPVLAGSAILPNPDFRVRFVPRKQQERA